MSTGADPLNSRYRFRRVGGSWSGWRTSDELGLTLLVECAVKCPAVAATVGVVTFGNWVINEVDWPVIRVGSNDDIEISRSTEKSESFEDAQERQTRERVFLPSRMHNRTFKKQYRETLNRIMENFDPDILANSCLGDGRPGSRSIYEALNDIAELLRQGKFLNNP